MNNKYSETQKNELVSRYLSGDSVSKVIAENDIPRSTFYAWIKKHNDEQNIGKAKNVSIGNYRILENKVERLKAIVKILQTASCTATAPLSEKLIVSEELYSHGLYSVRVLCEALGVDRGTFYNHIFRNLKGNKSYVKRREDLRIKIQEIYDDSKQIFGAKKITAMLKNKGERISDKMVSELMRDMGLSSIRQGAKSLHLKSQKRTPNLINQNFKTNAPDQVWVSDVTYFKRDDKWYYICVVIDLFSRKGRWLQNILKK